MGGHGSDDQHHQHTNVNAIQETDEELLYKIRQIELIKHNPNHFNVSISDLGTGFQILGGGSWLACTTVGALFGHQYYKLKLRHNPATFYASILVSFSRLFLGAVVGGSVGYMKFADRQRLHNAWVSERLRRRYPEALGLDQHDLWKLKGVRATHQFYKWT